MELNLEMSRFGVWLGTLETIGNFFAISNILDHWSPYQYYISILDRWSLTLSKVHGPGSYRVHGIFPDCFRRRRWKKHSWKYCHRWHLYLPGGLSYCTSGLKWGWIFFFCNDSLSRLPPLGREIVLLRTTSAGKVWQWQRWSEIFLWWKQILNLDI